MSYQDALEAAGARVIEFREFGSYQGEWVAKIGDDKYVMGYYGSCTGCDAFEGELGWADQDCDEHKYEHRGDCPACQVAEQEYAVRLRSFGESYLGTEYTKKELIEYFSGQADWCDEAVEAIKWLEMQ